MSSSTAPSLLGHTVVQENTPQRESRETGSLLDLMYDGFYLLLLLKNKRLPVDAGQFALQVRKFLTDFEKAARRQNVAAEDIFDAKYAFCAAIDEIILRSNSRIRDHWERNPLQLTLFGHQLAGETFFVKLEELRSQSKHRVQVLEVFHMCLLLGFEGRYLLEGPEKLSYLTARLGDDIAANKGKRSGFAPHWAPPDKVTHILRRTLPLWVIASAFGCIALLGFVALSWSLHQHTNAVIAGYGGVIQLAPNVAHVTITLP